ncbi:MAG: imidazolonepropionase [Phycisphaerales bacterium]|nr:imidazolonepropionase [Phycisphaerales bacterium]MCB9836333.1 imidazolonepropionase [Phycisphaera sp.]
MNELVITNARVLTMEGNSLGVRPKADVLIRGGSIEAIADTIDQPVAQRFDASGRVLMPAFVDCHTHACWAGSRLDEWERKLKGASYLELLEAGGGIMSTVRAVRNASREELRDALAVRLDRMKSLGTLTAEVKSGYGLSTESEVKMLEAIAEADGHWPGTVVPTACIGHAKDPDIDDFVRTTIEEILPEITRRFPGITIDAYCEKGSWSLDETLRLFDAALEAGHRVRVHADQFNDLGMIPEAIRRHLVSVDHLEATSPEHLDELAESETFGVMLPICGLHLDDRYANGRRFLDKGGRLAIATNYNPGSAPCCSMPMVVWAAVRHLGLYPDEAIRAATTSPAQLLGLDDRGVISHGLRADLVLLNTTDERELAFEFGLSPVAAVWAVGRRVV